MIILKINIYKHVIILMFFFMSIASFPRLFYFPFYLFTDHTILLVPTCVLFSSFKIYFFIYLFNRSFAHCIIMITVFVRIRLYFCTPSIPCRYFSSYDASVILLTSIAWVTLHITTHLILIQWNIVTFCSSILFRFCRTDHWKKTLN